MKFTLYSSSQNGQEKSIEACKHWKDTLKSIKQLLVDDEKLDCNIDYNFKDENANTFYVVKKDRKHRIIPSKVLKTKKNDFHTLVNYMGIPYLPTEKQEEVPVPVPLGPSLSPIMPLDVSDLSPIPFLNSPISISSVHTLGDHDFSVMPKQTHPPLTFPYISNLQQLSNNKSVPFYIINSTDVIPVNQTSVQKPVIVFFSDTNSFLVFDTYKGYIIQDNQCQLRFPHKLQKFVSEVDFLSMYGHFSCMNQDIVWYIKNQQISDDKQTVFFAQKLYHTLKSLSVSFTIKTVLAALNETYDPCDFPENISAGIVKDYASRLNIPYDDIQHTTTKDGVSSFLCEE